VLQFLADHVEMNVLFRENRECQELIMEAMKYHLLPERRLSLQSPRTKPRKSTVGVLYAVGGMDCTKGMHNTNAGCHSPLVSIPGQKLHILSLVITGHHPLVPLVLDTCRQK